MATHLDLRKVTFSIFGLLASAIFASLALSSHGLLPATYEKHDLRLSHNFLSRLVSPSTARAVAADEVFLRNLKDAVELTAELTRRLALHFDSVSELQDASRSIENYRRSLSSSTTQKRESLVDLLGLSGSSSTDTSSTSDSGILSGLTSSIGSAFSGLGSSLLQDASGAGMFLGTGLGAGAAQGLNLSTATKAMQVAAKVAADNGMNATGLNPMIQNAAMGATASFLGSLNTTNLLGNTGGDIDLHALAFGLATGIGNGTSAGLRLSPQSEMIQAPAGNTTQDIAGTFGFGLTKSVTSNINLSSLVSGSSGLTSGLTNNLNIGMIAQGAAMGLVQGAGDAVNSMGGIQALINGTATMPTAPLPGTNMAFNDSVGGAATGFGQGLGGQGTLVGVQLLSNINVTSLLEGLAGNRTSATEPTGSANNDSVVVRRHLFHPVEIIRRQAQVSSSLTANDFNLSLIINADSISSVSQSAIDALTCEGVGGLVLVALGLFSSGTIKSNSVASVNTTFMKQALPNGIIHFISNDNTFEIDGTVLSENLDGNLLAAAKGVSINGNTVVKFAAFIVVHILISLFVFISLVPAALSLEASRNLLVRLKMSHVFPNNMRWVDTIWLYVMSPLALLALLFGALAGGTATHFRTAHGGLGLATIIMTLVASASHFFAKRVAPDALQQAQVFPTFPFRYRHPLTIRTIVIQITLSLILPTACSGFADLGGMTLCVTRVIPLEFALGLGVGISFLYIVASALTGLTIWLSIRDFRPSTKELKDGVDEGALGYQSLKKKIHVIKE
ncbi:hypothetical protein N0V93_004550 [Gnomoniopsis smithogilvyi]|uniref:Uncharacterized protein n=1 Tax=Gnomoniopsis smithogilvyi TaxID=1191159 RepID=A0A9W9CXA7_9PEZI|nr:hypothetical protein N0V93_004550 [Gnomoniopsis smithogilvyi]